MVLEGTLRAGPNNTWQAEHLELVKRPDSRASFRMDVDLEGAVCAPGQPERPCRLLNISTGGALVELESRHNVGDRLLLRVDLLPETHGRPLACQILRIDRRRHGCFVYGCRFLDLEAADENRVLRAIMEHMKE